MEDGGKQQNKAKEQTLVTCYNKETMRVLQVINFFFPMNDDETVNKGQPIAPIFRHVLAESMTICEFLLIPSALNSVNQEKLEELLKQRETICGAGTISFGDGAQHYVQIDIIKGHYSIIDSLRKDSFAAQML